MNVLAESVLVPAELVVALAGLIGAAAYAIRKVVASRPSADEDARAVLLQGVREIHKEVRQVRGMLARVPGCAWSDGRPESLDERLARLRLEVDQDARRRTRPQEDTNP